MAVIGVGLGVICSPVSAAMAAMITLTDVPPYNLDLADVMLIVVPACFVGIVAGGLFSARRGVELLEDPEYLRRVAAGELQPPGQAESTAGELGATKEGRNSATVFLLGVAVIVLLGLFPDLRPQIGSGEEVSPLSMTTVIQLVMFTSGTLIVLICKPKVSDVPSRSVFKAGMTAAIALFGLAWLTDTFIKAHQDAIVDVIGGWVQSVALLFAVATLVIAALTTSQSTATRTIVPIGLASGLSAGAVVGMWPAVGGVYAMPTNGTQIAAANFDRSGTTRLGTKLFDHSFLLPMLVTVAVSVGVGLALGTVLG
jgi:anaerobic C4-dicarboxylate transporter DcuA/anaerobic C4-dicarboxylate transporter DcuB